MNQEIKNKIMSELNNSHEPFTHIIYAISQKIDNTNYKYCYKLWSFNDMYQEYFGSNYIDTERFYKIQENMNSIEFEEYLKKNEPNMHRLYWGD